MSLYFAPKCLKGFHEGSKVANSYLEPDQGCGLSRRVLELSHDLRVDGTALVVDQSLLGPTHAVANQALVDVHPVNVLKKNIKSKNADIFQKGAKMWEIA